MITIKNAPQKLIDLIFLGLDHGIDSIRSGGSLIPFIITENKEGSGGEIRRFFTETVEGGEQKAEKYLKILDPTPDYAIVACGGYVTIDGEKKDAIMVKGFDKTQEEGYILVQRYRPRAFLRSLKTIGNAAFMGSEPNILKK